MVPCILNFYFLISGGRSNLHFRARDKSYLPARGDNDPAVFHRGSQEKDRAQFIRFDHPVV